jgi:oligopeptide transport system substrate-binding protein
VPRPRRAAHRSVVARACRRPSLPWGRRVGVAALAIALAACTGGGAGERAGERAGPQPRTGGTLAIALLDPGSLDPARAETLEDEIVVGNLFDGLTAIDPAGAVRPAVAASWTSDPGLRHWEFRLRPDARFADGSTVSAEDFKFAWERLADPKAAPRRSPATAALLAPVSGYRAFAAGRAEQIAGITAPDPATLRVDLDRPFADFPAAVASVELSPLPRALVGGDPAAYLTRPVGNGPFRLAGRVRAGRPLVLERNPAYWGATAHLDRVSVHLVPDELTAWLELQNGRVAFAPVPTDQLAAAGAVYGLSSDGRGRPGLLQGPALTVWQVGFDLRRRPASDPRWRQAFSLAIDRRRIAAAVGATVVPAAGLVPPGTPAAGEPGASGAALCPACAHDPARAKALFAQVNAGSAPVTLQVAAGGVERRIGELLAHDLTAAGLKVQLKVSDDPKGTAAVRLGRMADYPRMDAFLHERFSSRGTANRSGFRDAAVDRLLDQARGTADEPARSGRYRQAEAAILAELPAAPLLDARHAAVLAGGVEGFDLTPWGAVDLAAVSLST